MSGIEHLKKRLDRVERKMAGHSIIILRKLRDGRILHNGVELNAEECEKLIAAASVTIIDNINVEARTK